MDQFVLEQLRSGHNGHLVRVVALTHGLLPMHCCELWANSREVSPEAALEGGGHAFLHVHQWGKQAIDPSLNDKSNYCTLQGRPSLTTADSLTVPPPQREPVPSFSTRAQVNLLIRFCPTINQAPPFYRHPTVESLPRGSNR
jgi:hypothetical protein